MRRFGLDDSDLLGAGGESWVYALDETRTLRISRGGDRRRYLELLKRFYRTLPPRPFAFPDLLEIGALLGCSYAVEARVPGVPLSEVLPGLARDERKRALESYLSAAEALASIAMPQAPYGQLLALEPITAPSWQAFLTRVVERAVRDNDLADDAPQLEAVVAETLAAIAILPDPPKALVHGDYFPGNVMIGEDLTVEAVIDFSPHTVVGDPLMDVAGALIFLEVVDGYLAEDSESLHALIRRRYGPGIDAVLQLYRRYYAFYFSGAKDDRALYRWCLDNLRPGRNGGAR